MAKTKKVYKPVVTERQKKLADMILKEGGKISMKKAMKAVGYSDAYAKNSQVIKKKKGWHFLMERDLPEELITAGIKDLLGAGTPETMNFPPSTTAEEVENTLRTMGIVDYHTSKPHHKSIWYVWYKKPDFTNRNQALEKLIKIRGKFAAEKVELVDGDISSKSTQELFDEIEKMKADNLIRYDLHEQSSKQRGGDTKKAKGDKKKDDNGKA